MLNAKQFAEALHLSKAGAYNLLNAEDFPTLKIGGRKLVMKQDLLLWLQNTPTVKSWEKQKTANNDCPNTTLCPSSFYLKIAVFPNSRADKNHQKMPPSRSGAQKGVKMRTGLTKRQKTTEIFFDETKSRITVYTHNTDLKKRLTAYAEQYPNHCNMTDEDTETGYKAFEIENGRLSFRLTAPYSKERRQAASNYVKQNIRHKRN